MVVPVQTPMSVLQLGEVCVRDGLDKTTGSLAETSQRPAVTILTANIKVFVTSVSGRASQSGRLK